MPSLPKKVLTLFGTRPEVIKLSPVIRELERMGEAISTINVTSAQHVELLYPFTELFGIRIDHDMQVMTAAQTPSTICSRVLISLDNILEQERPDLLLVQGDTSTALAGALAGFHRRIPVGHVEAGLRSGNTFSPFPEEMNRRLISRLATLHFAATPQNREVLLAEGVAPESVFVTGNPVVDALRTVLRWASPLAPIRSLLERTAGLKRVVLTTHRRESFGATMMENLRSLRTFIEQHEDVTLIFPVHPNPQVRAAARELLAGCNRIHLIDPLSYQEFIVLLSECWLIVSDSGGIQEEAPTLRKRLLVLRENTERNEGVEQGLARLVGSSPGALTEMLEEVYRDVSWEDEIGKQPNPYGNGDSAEQIAMLIASFLGARLEASALAGVLQ
jgi:UDP-N-acetylglucosamine 2-epimerase (non-hydrolysing)